MNLIPIELENIILDYVSQLNLYEKIQKINNDIIIVVNERKKFIKYIFSRFDDNTYFENINVILINRIFTSLTIEYDKSLFLFRSSFSKDIRYKWLVHTYINDLYIPQNFFICERNNIWQKPFDINNILSLRI